MHNHCIHTRLDASRRLPEATADVLSAIHTLSTSAQDARLADFPNDAEFDQVHAAIAWLQRQSALAVASVLSRAFQPIDWSLRVDLVCGFQREAGEARGPVTYDVYADAADHSLQLCFHYLNDRAGPGQSAAIEAFYREQDRHRGCQDLVAESVNRLFGTGFFSTGGHICSIDGEVRVISADPARPWELPTDMPLFALDGLTLDQAARTSRRLLNYMQQHPQYRLQCRPPFSSADELHTASSTPR